jgi:hypothetical protein
MYGSGMLPSVVYGYDAEQAWRLTRREYYPYKDFARPMKRGSRGEIGFTKMRKPLTFPRPGSNVLMPVKMLLLGRL